MNVLQISATVSLALLASCTGDPRGGGIFWSPSKAQERQHALVHQLHEEEANTQVVLNRHAQLKRQYALSKSQLAKARAQLRSSVSRGASAIEIEQLKLRVSKLEKEVAARRSVLLKY